MDSVQNRAGNNICLILAIAIYYFNYNKQLSWLLLSQQSSNFNKSIEHSFLKEIEELV